MDESVALMVGNPTEIVAGAKVGAQALTAIIQQKPKKVIINGEQYIEFEDWQTVGQFFGVGVRTGDAEPVQINGIDGAKASAELIHLASGNIIGGAEAYCMRDEQKWQNKPWYQLASMAQTRAGAKALRNRFAWVVVLAGFKTTPAEEMPDANDEAPTVNTGKHICPIHNVPFFKKGKMKGYAHKIEGTDEWCNEQTKETEPPTPTETAPEAPKSTTAASKRNPDTILTWHELQKACFEDFKLQTKKDVLAECGGNSWDELTELPAFYYSQIAKVRE